MLAALAASADPYAPPGAPLDPDTLTFRRDRSGRIARSRAVVRAFRAAHPCPSTEATTGPCPGYVVDHIRALSAGGADAIYNLQWQSAAAAYEKDRTERIKNSSPIDPN